MKSCLSQLNGNTITFPRLEAIAILIHESMSNSSRNYHSVQHVFDISQDIQDPIAILSAFFHDCIYVHVDGGLSRVQAKLLKGTYRYDECAQTPKFFAQSSDNKNSNTNMDQDSLLNMVECIFGYQPGQELTTQNGLNEFLSAIIAVRELQEQLTFEQLAQIACCIESTIPFRQVHPETGLGPLDRLYANMDEARQRFDLTLLQDEDLVTSVQRAAILSNNDVGNFGTSDRAWFLDNTWSLLPETNETLRNRYLYTIQEFQHGIFKMYGFFSFLQPSVVFQSFRGVPSEEEVGEKLEQCTMNLEIGKKYVGAKLVAVSVLAAFAELTGGDAPMSLFLGDLPSRHHVCTKIEDALPDPPKEHLKDCDQVVYNILADGRKCETSFDTRQSPLAAYLYGYLGDKKLQSLLGKIKFHPMEQENSLELLTSLPREAIQAIAVNMIKVALSRAEGIQQVLDTLPQAGC
jgi:hypothetical protein